MSSHKRYQLIEPYVGTKVYESSSLTKGAGKCYNELKQSGKMVGGHFTVMDIESYQKFTFGIGGGNQQSIHYGGNGNTNANANVNTNANANANTNANANANTNEHNKKIKELEKRIIYLETLLSDPNGHGNGHGNRPVVETFKVDEFNNKNNDVCVML